MYSRRTLPCSTEEMIRKSSRTRSHPLDIELEQSNETRQRRQQPNEVERTNIPHVARAFSIPTTNTDKILPIDLNRLRRTSIDHSLKIPTNISSGFAAEPIVNAATPAVIEEK